MVVVELFGGAGWGSDLTNAITINVNIAGTLFKAHPFDAD